MFLIVLKTQVLKKMSFIFFLYQDLKIQNTNYSTKLTDFDFTKVRGSVSDINISAENMTRPLILSD